MRTMFWLWIAASVCWVVVVGNACLQSWPHLSLDLSPGDAGTQAAYSAAVYSHVALYGLIAIAPPLVVMFVGWLFLRR